MNAYAPEQVEAAIREISERITRGVKVCAERYVIFQEANREYDQQFATAYLKAHDRPAHERKYVAELATLKARKSREEAEAAHRYAEKQAHALELELRALQSVGASVRAMYAVAGRGEQ